MNSAWRSLCDIQEPCLLGIGVSFETLGYVVHDRYHLTDKGRQLVKVPRAGERSYLRLSTFDLHRLSLPRHMAPNLLVFCSSSGRMRH